MSTRRNLPRRGQEESQGINSRSADPQVRNRRARAVSPISVSSDDYDYDDSFIHDTLNPSEWEDDWESSSADRQSVQALSPESDNESTSSSSSSVLQTEQQAQNDDSDDLEIIVQIPIVTSESNTETTPAMPKRPRLSEDAPMPATSSNNVQDDDITDDGCTICYEDYTSSGEHRLVSLKCGHFFGKACIERWIRSEGRTAGCPNCKHKANIKDIRIHFTKTVQMTDTSIVDDLMVKNQKLEKENTRLEIDLAKTKRLVIELQEKIKVDEEKKKVVSIPNVIRQSRMVLKPWLKTQLLQKANINPNARAFDFCGENFFVGIAMNIGSLFPQYAIRKITLDWRKAHLIVQPAVPLHTNRNRVIAVCPFNSSLILSAGEDKKAVVHTSGVNQNSRSWSMPDDRQVWAGCWLSDTNFVVGLQNGRVYEYSVSENDFQRDITKGNDRYPIIFMSYDAESATLLVSSFKKIVAYRNETAYVLLDHIQDRFDSIRSVTWDSRTLSYVVTFVGGANKPISHKLYKLEIDERTVFSSEINSWQTTSTKCSTMWNNAVFSLGTLGIFSLVFDEDKRQLEAHDWSGLRTPVVLSFPCKENVCNMKAFVNPNNLAEKIIAVLTESYLYLVSFGLFE